MERFQGKVAPAKALTNSSALAGQRVLVLGGGKAS